MDGNALADKYAKLGVEEHGITPQHLLEMRVFTKIAYQAAKWAATQYVIMSNSELKDSDRLQPKQKLPQAKRKTQLRPPRLCTIAEGPLAQNTAGQHSIRACTVSDNSTLVFCTICGAFKCKRTSKLGSPCQRRIAGLGARQRLRMINRGLYPNSSLHMIIGLPRAPTALEISSIRINQTAWNTAQPRSRINKWKRLSQPIEVAPSRASILEAYGHNEETFKARTAILAANDARRNPPQDPAHTPPAPVPSQRTDTAQAAALHDAP